MTAAISDGWVKAGWGWPENTGDADRCDIRVDRGDDKGFRFFNHDSTPGCVDTEPFPPAVSSRGWRQAAAPLTPDRL